MQFSRFLLFLLFAFICSAVFTKEQRTKEGDKWSLVEVRNNINGMFKEMQSELQQNKRGELNSVAIHETLQ